MSSVTMIDSGLLIYAATTMLSGGVPVLMPTARQEIIRRFALLCHSLHSIAGSDHCMIACDAAPYIRSGHYTEWYRSNAKQVAVSTEKGERTYLQFDNGYHPIFTMEGVFILGKPLIVKEQAALLAEIEAQEITPLAVEDKYFELLPSYKQGRNKGKLMENLGITQAEYYNIEKEALERVGHWLKAKVLKVQGLEADDVVAFYSKYAPASVTKITLCSRDSDWRQLALMKEREVEVLDVCKGTRWSTSQRDDIIMQIRGKIVGGDTSDAIKGLPKGQKGCYGKNPKAEFLGEHYFAFKDMPEFKRNRDLILLPSPLLEGEKYYADIKAVAIKKEDKIPEFLTDRVVVNSIGSGSTVFNYCFVSDKEIEILSDKMEIKVFIKKITGDIIKKAEDNEDSN